MYFFIFKTNGHVKHVIKAETREDANIQLKALTGENPSWDHLGARVSVVHCEYKAQQSVYSDAGDSSQVEEDLPEFGTGGWMSAR